MLYGCIERRDLYPVACRRTCTESREKNIEILSTTDGKKKLEIDYKNLEVSEICTDKKSRDLHFSRNVNLEKIYLYDGPKGALGRLRRSGVPPARLITVISIRHGGWVWPSMRMQWRWGTERRTTSVTVSLSAVCRRVECLRFLLLVPYSLFLLT
jgi:hypothetical protein